MEKSMKERVTSAAIKYLKMQGFVDLEAYNGYVVGKDGRELVFCRVGLRSNGFDPAGRIDNRGKFERDAMVYMAAHDFVDTRIRFDDIQMQIVGADKALLRHEKNCLA